MCFNLHDELLYDVGKRSCTEFVRYETWQRFYYRKLDILDERRKYIYDIGCRFAVLFFSSASVERK